MVLFSPEYYDFCDLAYGNKVHNLQNNLELADFAIKGFYATFRLAMNNIYCSYNC